MKHISLSLPGKDKLFIIMLILSLLNAYSLAASTLVLKEKAVVSDHIVRIKDIANMDNPTRNRLGDLVVAVAPEMGQSGTIARQEIVEKLVGNGFQDAQLSGATEVTVTRKGAVISPTFFKEQIHNYITTHSQWKEDVQVTLVSAKEVIVPETGVRWQITPANGQDFFGNVLFKIEAYSPTTNEMIYSNWLVAKLTIVKEVALSNRMIQKNETIGSSDIRWEKREITAFIKDALFTEQEIVGERTGRIIRPNSIITASLMEKKLMVKRGAPATLMANFKNIQATITVTALSDGAIGESIRVMNPQSKRIISATVVGKNKLEVNVE